LQVEDEIELGRLQNRKIGGLAALEDCAAIDADLMACLRSLARDELES
jgi:hypothetical protein